MGEPNVSAHVITYPWRGALRAMRTVRSTRQLLAADTTVTFAVVGRSSAGSGARDVSRSLSLRRLVALVEWSSPAAAASGRSVLDERWRREGASVWSGLLASIRAHGTWRGVEAFRPHGQPAGETGFVLALTYAQIRWRRFGHFYVAGFPASARRMTRPPSPMLAGLGFGDVPIRHACTISLWHGTADLDAIAYGVHEVHGDVVRRSTQEDWLSESLFARFALAEESGVWGER